MNTIRLNEPMRWEAFKELPDDLQREYLLGLRERFHASMSRISTDMFGLASPYLTIRLERKGIYVPGSSHKLRMSKEQEAKWLNWLGKTETEPEPEPEPETETEPETEPAAVDIACTMDLRGVSNLRLSFSMENGTLESLIDALKRMPIPAGGYTVDLTISGAVTL